MKKRMKRASALLSACALGLGSIIPTMASEIPSAQNDWYSTGQKIVVQAEQTVLEYLSVQNEAKNVQTEKTASETQNTKTETTHPELIPDESGSLDQSLQTAEMNDSAYEVYQTAVTSQTIVTEVENLNVTELDLQSTFDQIDQLLAQAQSRISNQTEQPEEKPVLKEESFDEAAQKEKEAKKQETEAAIFALNEEKAALNEELAEIESQPAVEEITVPAQTEAPVFAQTQLQDETEESDGVLPEQEEAAEPAADEEASVPEADAAQDSAKEIRRVEIASRLAEIDQQIETLTLQLQLLDAETEADQNNTGTGVDQDTETDAENPETPAAPVEKEKPVYSTVYEWKKYVSQLEADLKNEDADAQWIASELARSKEALKKYETITMHRLYNPNSGEHFYTSSNKERDNLVKVGWRHEGTGWLAPKNGGSPVYRLYNPVAGEHHYTSSSKESDNLVKNGWKLEGIGWYSFDVNDPNAVGLLRQYNPNAFAWNHNYTPSFTEDRNLVRAGWKAEGIGWFGIYPYSRVQEVVENKTITRFYDPSTMKVLSGQKTIYDDSYYFNPSNNNAMSTGIVTIPASQNSGTAKTCIYNNNGIRLNGMTTWQNKTYCLDIKTGAMKKGYMLLDAPYVSRRNFYYFDADGAMVKGKTITVDGKSMTFNSDGTKKPTAAEQIQLDCLNVYDKVGRNLWNCFSYISSNTYRKLPIPLTPPAGRTEEENYALIGLEQRSGNCYTYAASFAALARHLGYTAKMVKGSVATIYGTQLHGWTEILVNGVWYICDGSFQNSTPYYKCYMQPKSNPTFIYYW